MWSLGSTDHFRSVIVFQNQMTKKRQLHLTATNSENIMRCVVENGMYHVWALSKGQILLHPEVLWWEPYDKRRILPWTDLCMKYYFQICTTKIGNEISGFQDWKSIPGIGGFKWRNAAVSNLFAAEISIATWFLYESIRLNESFSLKLYSYEENHN